MGDNCDNPSEAANPDAFCSDWLTFRGKGKEEGVQTQDDEIRSGLEEIQPPLIDIKGTISAEEVTNVSELPRGSCTGTLIPDSGVPPTTVGPPTTTTVGPPTTTTVGPPTPTTTTTSPTTTTTESEGSEEGSEECFDIWSVNKCWRRKEKGKCNKKWVAKNCQETCEKC